MCTVWPSHSKWLSEYGNKSASESASNFVLSLNIPPQKLFKWLRRLQLWTGDWQLHQDNVPVHVSSLLQSFWWNTKSIRWLSPLQPRFGALRLLAFPKTKITFEREEISDHWWNSGKWENATWQLMATGRTAWHTKMPTLKGTEASLSYLLCFLYLASSSINVTIFHITWMDIYTQGPAEVTPAWVWLVG